MDFRGHGSRAYTKCKTACPLLVDDLKEIASDLKKKEYEIDVTVFSFDSKNETAKSLMEFAKKRNLAANWKLFSSNASAVAELAGALGVRYKLLKDGEYIHSNVIYFLDKKGEVLAQKEGLNTPRKAFLEKVVSTLGPG